MPKELVRIKKLFRSLVAKTPMVFPNSGERLSAPERHGVYIIYGPRNQVLHVGRTLRGRRGLRQRLNNHLHGSSSFTVEYLAGKGSKLRGSHSYSYVEIADARTRALLEAYAVGNLCPKHLGLGEKAS